MSENFVLQKSEEIQFQIKLLPLTVRTHNLLEIYFLQDINTYLLTSFTFTNIHLNRILQLMLNIVCMYARDTVNKTNSNAAAEM